MTVLEDETWKETHNETKLWHLSLQTAFNAVLTGQLLKVLNERSRTLTAAPCVILFMGHSEKGKIPGTEPLGLPALECGLR